MAGAIQHLLSLQSLEKPSANEYLAHPEYRQIASFFLGWAFFCSLHYFLKSSFLRYMSRNIAASVVERLYTSPVDEKDGGVDAIEFNVNDGKARRRRSFWRRHSSIDGFFLQDEHPSLVFLLTLLFALSSLAQFGSLSVFSPSVGSNRSDTLCAFVVAWSGMAFQSAHYVGLLTLGLDLRALGAKTWESVVFWLWLLIGTGLVFASNGISIGVLSIVQTQAPFDLTFCYRRHFFPTAIALSLVSICLEVYCLFRFTQLLVPSFLKLKHKLDAMKDLRIAKTVSLLLLDFLIIVPSSIPTNILTDFIPFSLGAVIVLVVFNCQTSHSDCHDCFLTSFPTTRAPSLSTSYRNSRAAVSLSASSVEEGIQYPSPSLQIQIPKVSAAGSDDGSDAEEIPHTARTDWSVDSRMAHSLSEAVLQTVTPLARRSVRVRHLPPMPHMASQRASPINFMQPLPFNLEPNAVPSDWSVPVNQSKGAGGNISAKKVSFSKDEIIPTSARQAKVLGQVSARHLSAPYHQPVFYQEPVRSRSEGSLVQAAEENEMPFGEDYVKRALQYTHGLPSDSSPKDSRNPYQVTSNNPSLSENIDNVAGSTVI